MPHRNDIDGLRAIAVLSVVFYHLGPFKAVGGGFVGVDVFFVISGYLITGIIQSELDAGKFSVAAFYNRRVRRIFPALFAVYLFCLVASALLEFPAEAKNVGRDVLWSLAFLSNVLFSRATGYFDQASRTDPLLHTWSLSVEEQFYVVFPLLLASLWRLGPRVRNAILLFTAALSLVASERMLAANARHAFYFVQYRAWELLLGSFCALGIVPQVTRRAVAEVLTLAGLAAIFFAIFSIRSTTPFPGYWAIPPSAGAAAILHGGARVRTLGARLLGLAPLRWVGLISYSFYLWHWPLIAFYGSRHDSMTLKAALAILALALLISALSYRFIEEPFRTKPYRRSVRTVLLLGASGMASVAILSVSIPAIAARLKPSAALADAALKYLDYNIDIGSGTCFLSSGYNDLGLFRKDLCLKQTPGRRSLLIMGDSHAAHFTPAFRELHPELDVLQATASGCEAVRRGTGAQRCTQLMDFVFDEFLPQHHVDTIVLAGRWPRDTLHGLEKTIAYLKPLASRVIVLGPVVEYSRPFPQLLASSITSNDGDIIKQHLLPAQHATDLLFARRLRGSGADYYSVYNATCPSSECTSWAAPGVPMQYDEHHLTLGGSELVLDRLGLARGRL
ncbi:MAG TPA: acyltransferase family protein [Polyangiaceae bacterium]|jgi:peptidoglycan/LPS O-acetylase OafA/YrhL